MHGSGDVLDLLFSDVLECDGKPVAHLVVDGAADADAARLGKALEPRRDVDAFAKNVAPIADDVAEVDSWPP